MKAICLLVLLLLTPIVGATPAGEGEILDLTQSSIGYWALAIFAIAYLLVMLEEQVNLRKSKPVVIAAGIIWGMIAWHYHVHGDPQIPHDAIKHNFLEFTELMMFLLVAMTYINAMSERNVFQALRSWLIRKGFSLRQVFWVTGVLAFIISPVADNLTTALLMCAVVLAVGANNKEFIGLACINIVVAANAGGAPSPFGDITTLMVWQAEKLQFTEFFVLLLPAVIAFLVPATIMHFFVPKAIPVSTEKPIHMKRGAKRIILLFILTIVTAVSFHNVLHLPPVIGMMTGLGYLQFFGYYIKMTVKRDIIAQYGAHQLANIDVAGFDIFRKVARAEWDTLFFFYGVVLCVGGLGLIGYLEMTSLKLYGEYGATIANISIGIASAIVDNIPVMFAVLKMDPTMSQGQWLLVTLTAGIGGSLLSIGSAAGVALMGQAHGKYTFFGHLKWMPVIALGYAAAIAVHFLVNAHLF
jgi:NhaD family Na+/H+ antiporter